MYQNDVWLVAGQCLRVTVVNLKTNMVRIY